jgi:hypothetical protein
VQAKAAAAAVAAADAGAVDQQHSLLLLQAAASNPDLLASMLSAQPMLMQQLFMSGVHQAPPLHPHPHYAQPSGSTSAGGAVQRAPPMAPMHNAAALSDLGGWPAAASPHPVPVRPAGAAVAARTTSQHSTGSTGGGERAPAWSATVNMWLQEYERGTGATTQHRTPGAEAGAGAQGVGGAPVLDLRRSFDASPYVERRRSTRDSLSRVLDSLNLADAGIVTAEPPATSRPPTGSVESPGRLGGVFGSGPWGAPAPTAAAKAASPVGKGGALSLLPALGSWEGDDRIGTAIDQRGLTGGLSSLSSSLPLPSARVGQHQPLHHRQVQQHQHQHQHHHRPHLPSIDFGALGVSPPRGPQQQAQDEYAAALHQLNSAHAALQALQARGAGAAPGHLTQAAPHHGQQAYAQAYAHMGISHLRNP